MRVSYLHLPRFAVQRRVVEQPSLQGQPVVLQLEERGTFRVRCASGAALQRGVRPGQAVAAAQALVPDLVKRPFDEVAERRALGALGEALLPFAPGFQVDTSRLEGLWLDASPAHLFGAGDLAQAEAAWAQRVLAAARQLGLVGRCVVASERFTAQALARFTQAPAQVVAARGGGALAALPLTTMEAGWLGPGAVGPLQALGLGTLGELSALSPGALVARFGAWGHTAARLCRGEDDTCFTPDALPEVLEEHAQLDWPAEQLEPVLFALKMAVDRLCSRLQGRQQAAVRLTVALQLEGASGRLVARPAEAPLTVPLRLARPSSQAKLLVELIRHRLVELTVEQPIAALHVRVDEACAEPGRQLMLGDAPAGEAELEVVLSRLQSALGDDALFSAEPQAQHCPEQGWRAVPFRPPDGGRISELWGVMEADWQLGARTEGDAEGDRAGRQALNERLALTTPRAPPVAPVQAPPEDSPWGGPRGRAAASHEEAQVGDLLEGLLAGDTPAAWPKAKTVVAVPALPSVGLWAQRPARLFPSPSKLVASHSAQGALETVVLLGRARRVTRLLGPERLVSHWWAEQPFARDYYRLELEGVGALWVYRDGSDGELYAQGVFD
jgi:protein ImuB